MKALVVNRGTTVGLADLPGFSIALDGYVQGPALDLASRKISFDHHDGVIRTFTSATCKQVLDAILLGLDPAPYTVYVNDVDGDTALSVFLLRYPRRATEPAVRALVEVVGAIDAHGPAYPCSDPALASAFYDWAMAPERDARRNKTYGTASLEQLLDQCVENIGRLIEEGPGKFAMMTKAVVPYVLTHTHPRFVMARAEGFVFGELYGAGHRVAVVYRQLGDGSYEYTIGKQSSFVDFPLGPHTEPGTALYALRRAEPGWGGGDSIGGAPRNPDGSRSKLTPDEVFSVISALL